MQQPSDESTHTFTEDARRDERRAVEAPVRMRIEAAELEGLSDNISAVGLMFFTEQPLRVVVEVEVDGQPRSFRGRLVRAQKMSAEATGYAIEFDPH